MSMPDQPRLFPHLLPDEGSSHLRGVGKDIGELGALQNRRQNEAANAAWRARKIEITLREQTGTSILADSAQITEVEPDLPPPATA